MMIDDNCQGHDVLGDEMSHHYGLGLFLGQAVGHMGCRVGLECLEGVDWDVFLCYTGIGVLGGYGLVSGMGQMMGMMMLVMTNLSGVAEKGSQCLDALGQGLSLPGS